MINEISSSDVEVQVQEEYQLGLIENSQENPNLIQNQNNQRRNSQNLYQELVWDFFKIISSTVLGAGVGYLAGGMIKVIVDLSKKGIEEIQKQSQEEGLKENAKRYIGLNEFTISGLSLGAIIGVVTCLTVIECIRLRNEREMELRAVRNIVAENDIFFNGALSTRQEMTINNGNSRSENESQIVGAQITFANGDTHESQHNPVSILNLGGGNLTLQEADNLISQFQSSRSRESSVESSSMHDVLRHNEFEKLLKGVLENSKILEREESERAENDQESSSRSFQIESAQKFLESIGCDFSKGSPNLVFVNRPKDRIRRGTDEISLVEDDGIGVRSNLNDYGKMSAFESALQSLQSPRGDIQSLQAMETRKDLKELSQASPFFKALEKFQPSR